MPEQITIQYRPHKYQLSLHQSRSRFKVIVCHRRFGKTVYAVNQGIRKVLTCPFPEPRVMYCAPFLKQATSIAWDYLIKYSKDIPGIHINKQKSCVDYPNGGRFTLAGADNIDAHRGIYLDHLVCDEYAQMSPKIWGSVFRPALSDRHGSADFIGTPMGRGNSFYDLFERAASLPHWQRFHIPVSNTGLITPDELQSARLEMTEDEYLQEYECSWDAAIKGAFYAKQMADLTTQGKICSVPYEPELPVYTSCDLGMRDAFSMWFFQFAGDQIRFIDYEAFSGMGLPEIFRSLEKKPYKYADHIAPHDIRVRELGTGVSRIETARKLGVSYKIARNIPVQDGIDATRQLLKRCVFDKDKCNTGIEALRIYRCQYDDQLRVFSNAPLHDWSSNPADALRYAAVTYGKNQSAPPDLFERFQEPNYTQMNQRIITHENDRTRTTGRRGRANSQK
jgi:phage terminase large subunit